MKNGGYIIVSVADTNIYEKVNSALINGKPILFYDDTETAYYIDTIAKSGDDIILTKGGKTITIEADGDITESGEVQNHLYEYCLHYSVGDDNIYCNVISPKDIDFTTITFEKIYELLGQKTHSASGIVNFGDNEYAVVYAIHCDDTEIFMLGSTSGVDTDTSNLQIGIDAVFDESLSSVLDWTITKTQLF